jgi:hypothetical protein
MKKPNDFTAIADRLADFKKPTDLQRKIIAELQITPNARQVAERLRYLDATLSYETVRRYAEAANIALRKGRPARQPIRMSNGERPALMRRYRKPQT